MHRDHGNAINYGVSKWGIQTNLDGNQKVGVLVATLVHCAEPAATWKGKRGKLSPDNTPPPPSPPALPRPHTQKRRHGPYPALCRSQRAPPSGCFLWCRNRKSSQSRGLAHPPCSRGDRKQAPPGFLLSGGEKSNLAAWQRAGGERRPKGSSFVFTCGARRQQKSCVSGRAACNAASSNLFGLVGTNRGPLTLAPAPAISRALESVVLAFFGLHCLGRTAANVDSGHRRNASFRRNAGAWAAAAIAHFWDGSPCARRFSSSAQPKIMYSRRRAGDPTIEKRACALPPAHPSARPGACLRRGVWTPPNCSFGLVFVLPEIRL